MPKRLQTRAPGFEAAFAAFLAEKREVSAEVDAVVAKILAEVRGRGDAALVDLSRTFDHIDLDAVGMRVTREDVREALASCADDTLAALQLAADRIASRAPDPVACGATLEEVERQLIETTLAQYDGHRAKTAEALGIGLRTLSGKLRQYGYAPREKNFAKAG